MPTDLEVLSPRVRIMQIIVTALTLGCTTVLITMFFLRDAKAASPATPMLTYLGLTFGGLMILARLIVPGVIVAAARKQLASRSGVDEVQMLLGVYQIRMIVGAAPLEGAVFFLAVAYMLEGEPLALGVGAALTLVVAAHFPTTAGVAAWIADQQERMRLERFS